MGHFVLRITNQHVDHESERDVCVQLCGELRQSLKIMGQLACKPFRHERFEQGWHIQAKGE